MSPGDDGGIGGGIGANPQQAVYVTVYAQVDDLQATLDKAESLGGTHLMGPVEVPGGGEIAMFKDPEGNAFGLFRRTEG